MNSTTLRGVFPEPKPVYKKNFIKENVKHIKRMQGLVPSNEALESGTSQEKLQSKPANVKMQRNISTKSQSAVNQSLSHTLSNSKFQKPNLKRSKELIKIQSDRGKGEPLNIKPHLPAPSQPVEKVTHRGVQTDKLEDIQRLYKHGVVKYPSPSVIKSIAANKNAKKKDGNPNDDLLAINPNEDNLGDNMQELDINEKHNYIKENILALKQKSQRQDGNQDSCMPTGYQKGVLPKYLRDRKEEQKREAEEDLDCPEGHVLLPDEERKETLRVLRQSYADRIQELNSMPVRNDTLKMRKRKMVIEEELKKIDEGIKVFQRPKVFVKINA